MGHSICCSMRATAGPIQQAGSSAWAACGSPAATRATSRGTTRARAWRSPTWSPRRYTAPCAAPGSSRRTWSPSTSGTRSGSCSPGRGSSARCPPRSSPGCGASRPPGTRRPAPRAASRSSAPRAEIEAGRYDCVLVLAVEQERNVPGADAPKHLGAAAWIGHEGQDAKFMWPYMFSQLADEYDRRYGLNDAHLHAIAELNMRNAKDNPLAQTRGLDVRAGRLRRRRPRQPGRRGPAPPHRLRSGHRRGGRRAAGLRPL